MADNFSDWQRLGYPMCDRIAFSYLVAGLYLAAVTQQFVYFTARYRRRRARTHHPCRVLPTRRDGHPFMILPLIGAGIGMVMRSKGVKSLALSLGTQGYLLVRLRTLEPS